MLVKMMDRVEDKIQRELDVVNIIKEMKHLRVLVDKAPFDPLNEFLLEHSYDNVIDID